jgi:hypothetical protein
MNEASTPAEFRRLQLTRGGSEYGVLLSEAMDGPGYHLRGASASPQSTQAWRCFISAGRPDHGNRLGKEVGQADVNGGYTESRRH